MTPLFYLLGSVHVSFRSPRPERIINAMRKMGLPFRKLFVSDREASFEILFFRRGMLLPFLETVSPTEQITLTERGLPALVRRYRRRWGFFAGIALFFASLLLANCFIWGIDINGVTQDPELLFASLSDAGLSPGVWSRNMDTDGLARSFLVLHPEYAYAGIRLIGMRALVELRSAEEIDRTDPAAGYSNLVSEGSGRVLRCEVMAGEKLVRPGDLVKPGDLLVSGIRRTENGSFLPTRARGRVFCETEEAFEVFIPFETKETVFTGREEERESFFLLGRCIFFTGENSSFADYEKQVFFEPVRLFGWDLPVYRRTVVFSERVEKMTVANVDRAVDLAYDKYIIYKEKLLDRGGEIRREEPLWEERADGVYLCVRISAVRDLCREAPFTIQ